MRSLLSCLFLLFLFFGVNSLESKGTKTCKIRYQKEKVKEFLITEVIKSGHFLELSDNSIWKIAPKDVKISRNWILAPTITIIKNQDLDYPYILFNNITGKKVKAQISCEEEIEEIEKIKN